jgi:hypothetical protein
MTLMSSQSHLFREFEKLTFKELKSSKRLVEFINCKVELAGDHFSPDEEIQQKANLFAEMLTETLRDNYQALSIRAFAHISVALDYLLDPQDAGAKDGEPDTKPGGLASDRMLLLRTAIRFQREIEEFQKWKARQFGQR